MNEDETNGTENKGTPEAPWQEQLHLGVQQVTGFLSAIVVVDEYTIRDFLGNQYKFSPNLKARRAIKAGLTMDNMVQGSGDTAALMEAQAVAATSGKLAALMFFLRKIIEDEKTEKAFQELYEIIHPEIVLEAQKAAAEDFARRTDDPDITVTDTEPDTHVLDLFEVDALLEALVPFFARNATRIGDLVASVLVAPVVSPPSSHPNPSPH
jgi:hypothetical protein